jgi:hypothetical protein
MIDGDTRADADDPGEPGGGGQRRGIALDEEAILTGLARGRCVLEIGTGLGFSTRALARSAFHVVSVDVDPWVGEVIVPALQQELPWVDFVTQIPELVTFDLAFVDGEHSAEAVARDLRVVIRLGVPMVVMHDWGADPRVREGVERVIGVEAVGRVGVFATTYGMALLVDPKEVDSHGAAESV